jgi:competence protein ComEC
MPTLAFLLMVVGGLWLMLWQTRWRFAGVALIAGGVALAPTGRLPDLIVGREGTLVAVRGPDGLLAAVGATRNSYELERWLEHDGDARGVERAAKLGKGSPFACDGIGCRATVQGLSLAVACHPAAFADDCRSAGILVASIVSPRVCPAPKAIVDFFAARRGGTHAVYIGPDGRLRIETVAEARGTRPWSTPRARAPPAEDADVSRTADLQ